jgi:putative ABC transport system permease protein
MALLLVLMGIYGIIAYSVTERTQELGIRRALGAQPSDILRLVVGQSFRYALAGVALGIAGSFALTRLMEKMLFHISPTDPTTFLIVTILFLAIALLASYLPARRATRIDPALALRL